MTVSTIRVSGKLYDGSVRSKVVFNKDEILHLVQQYSGTQLVTKLEDSMNRFFKKFAIPSSVAVGMLSTAGQAFAAGATTGGMIHLADKLMPLLHMVQEFALPIGITVSSWGLIEMIMGNIESGKHKMKWAIIGYIGMFLIPQVFYAIRDAFAL